MSACGVADCPHPTSCGYAKGPVGSFPSVDGIYMWWGPEPLGDVLCQCHAFEKYRIGFGSECAQVSS